MSMLSLKLYFKNSLEFSIKELHVISTLSVTIYFNDTKLQLSLCLANTDYLKKNKTANSYFLCSLLKFYLKCWQSAKGMHHKITYCFSKKDVIICHTFGCFRRTNLNFQIELVNVAWMNAMLWELARWLQIVFHMQGYRRHFDFILLTHYTTKEITSTSPL